MISYAFFAAAAPAGPMASFLQSPLPMVIMMFAIMYFLVIRPQSQKQKQHAKMLAGLQKNDEVVTTGGILGTVVNVNDKTVALRIADNVRVEVEKSYIVQKTNK